MTTSIANTTKLESELRKAVASIRALKTEKDKLVAQMESFLQKLPDQEQSALLRIKFGLEREVCFAIG